MTLQEIRNKVDEIKTYMHDDNEHAHILEDVLLKLFIKYIATGDSSTDELLMEKAQEVLEVQKLDYTRWYA